MVDVSRRIVLTGGPGAGKSAISRRLAEAEPARFVVVPEAATAVYTALDTRWDRLDVAGRCDVQRQIFHHQIAQEEAYAKRHPGHTLLLDRGTLDGAAYWPHGPEDYWRDLGTTREAQLARYTAVIWLETAAALGLYDGDASNEKRFESAAAAIESGERLLGLWSGHPRLVRIPATTAIEEKLAKVGAILVAIGGGD